MPTQLKSLNLYFEDFSLGDRFATATRLVGEGEIVTYSSLSMDTHPIHTDPDAASAGPFGRRVAQGMLTLTLASGLETSLFDLSSDLRLLALYGIERVRFLQPVYIGDAIRVDGEVVQVTAKDDERGVVTFAEQIENQRGEAVASLRKLFLYQRRR